MKKEKTGNCSNFAGRNKEPNKHFLLVCLRFKFIRVFGCLVIYFLYMKQYVAEMEVVRNFFKLVVQEITHVYCDVTPPPQLVTDDEWKAFTGNLKVFHSSSGSENHKHFHQTFSFNSLKN